MSDNVKRQIAHDECSRIVTNLGIAGVNLTGREPEEIFAIMEAGILRAADRINSAARLHTTLNERERRARNVEGFEADDMLDTWVNTGDSDAFAKTFLAKCPPEICEAFIRKLIK